MDSALAVFAEVGIDKASVEAVCERAGFTRGAFYSNFATKEELFLAVCERAAEATIASVRRYVESWENGGSDSPDDTLALVKGILRQAVDDRLDAVLSAELRVRALRDPVFAAAYLALDSGLTESMARLVHDVASARGLRLRVPAEVASVLLLSAWNSANEEAHMKRASSAATDASLAERLAQVVQLVLG